MITEEKLLGVQDNPITTDSVNNPAHYTQSEIQPIDYILTNNMGYAEGCIIKYIHRYKDKGGIEDLKKAQKYLHCLINSYEDSDTSSTTKKSCVNYKSYQTCRD